MITAMAIFRVLATLAFLIWVWLAVARGMFWRTSIRLPAAGSPVAGAPDDWPAVAIVVPARDEAQVLPASLPTLVAQQYPGRVRVILVDDGSIDGTGDLATTRWPEVTVVDPGERPQGWAGKLWALQAGVAEAGEVEYLLLTDADIAHRPDSLASLVAAAEQHQLDLVSQMARLHVRSGWERLLVPAFVYFFAMLYPFRWSNKPNARTAASAGGCNLVRRTALERAGGIAAVRGAVIDDVALARTLKRSGARIFLGLADRVESVRPYPSLTALWDMVARSAYTQLHRSPVQLVGTVLGLAVAFLAAPVSTVVGAAAGDVWTLAAGLAGWLLMAALFAPMLHYYRQPWPAALALPFTAALYLAMTVDSALRHYRGRGAAWKGRTYG